MKKAKDEYIVSYQYLHTAKNHRTQISISVLTDLYQNYEKAETEEMERYMVDVTSHVSEKVFIEQYTYELYHASYANQGTHIKS